MPTTANSFFLKRFSFFFFLEQPIFQNFLKCWLRHPVHCCVVLSGLIYSYNFNFPEDIPLNHAADVIIVATMNSKIVMPSEAVREQPVLKPRFHMAAPHGGAVGLFSYFPVFDLIYYFRANES